MTNHFIFMFADASFLWPGGWFDYLKLMLILGGVLIAAFLTVRFWIPKLARINRRESGPIQVITRCSLEPNKTLYVVAVGSAKMLLASSEAGLQLIRTLASDDLEQTRNNKNKPEDENTFGRLLQSMRSRRNL